MSHVNSIRQGAARFTLDNLHGGYCILVGQLPIKVEMLPRALKVVTAWGGLQNPTSGRATSSGILSPAEVAVTSPSFFSQRTVVKPKSYCSASWLVLRKRG